MEGLFGSFKKQFQGWSVFEKCLITVMLLGLMYTSYVWQDNIVGIICTIAGVLCVVLVSKGNIWNYFWGVINVALYAYIAYNAGYGGDFVLNAFYYLPMNFVGLYYWRKNYGNENEEVVDVQKMTVLNIVLTVVLLFIATYLIGRFMPFINSLLGMESNPSPFVDAFTSAGSVIAMYLMVRRYASQWLMWIIINVLSIYMWTFVMVDYTMTIMWSAYLLNAIYGYYNWKKLEGE